MNTTITPAIRAFFETFNKASAALDMPVILSQFAEEFLYVTPAGSRVIRREQFAAGVAKQKEMFGAYGLVSAETLPVEEERLNDCCTLVNADVTMIFDKQGTRVALPPQRVSYVLFGNESPVICFYSNANDMPKIMEAAGLKKG